MVFEVVHDTILGSPKQVCVCVNTQLVNEIVNNVNESKSLIRTRSYLVITPILITVDTLDFLNY